MINEMETLGLDTEGTLDTVRQQINQYVDEHPDLFCVIICTSASAPQLTKSINSTTITVLFAPIIRPPQLTLQQATPVNSDDRKDEPTPTKIMKQISKWGGGVHFNVKNPCSFLEQEEELRLGYNYTDNQILLRLSEPLMGDALL